ncbi:mitochondrial Complex IV (CIV) cytochrome c:O2 oxidoreductase subunit 4 (Cox4) [Andalucia godoyi]|uniref:Mitochondrial Complex IV (CIV) cytochrome c:O2 oxidoreductase subunit 4 (Cox4) n=1 Tax=Andalucia godoyi TaxID=505711 RepID=A0A8K0AJA8_ANDGO|nr:mitochondrial Complex IV (CIV) cytochrome c:O2 oxidoreductase subunit 4 (Cox4) [Andalucia godoyi]|eukprot:ANDGO_04011.mRNA.1 mitochondrial Complex IV (CIV) cytochrome c:O2 oxidoreductase subunit 4 (Cox4)
MSVLAGKSEGVKLAAGVGVAMAVAFVGILITKAVGNKPRTATAAWTKAEEEYRRKERQNPLSSGQH